MAFVLGMVAIGAVLWWLARLKRRDIADCRAVLAFDPAPPSSSLHGTTPEGFACVEHTLLRGVMFGRPATLSDRTVRFPKGAKYRRGGSQFTVLAVALAAPAHVSLRLQPAGILGGLEAALRAPADSPDVVAIDPAFDAAYTVYADTPADARTVLTPDMREKFLAFRTRVAGPLPANVAGRLASGLVLGTFHVDGSTARYVVFGSPTKQTAEHVKAAAPLLLELADAARA